MSGRPFPLEEPVGNVSLKGRHFYNLAHFSKRELESLLEAALEFKRGRGGLPLAGKSVALLFFDPSLRTRASMEVAIHQLGGQAVVLQPGQGIWDLEFEEGAVMDGSRPEHVKEAAGVLSRYVAAVCVRAFPKLQNWEEDKRDKVLKGFLQHSRVPVINLESCWFHPCQALADLMTLRERLGSLEGKKVVLSWACHPKPLPMAVPNSFALMASQFGCQLTIARPPEYTLDLDLVELVRRNMEQFGLKFRETTSMAEALEDAEAVYPKSWGSLAFYGRWEAEKAVRGRYRNWIVDQEQMNRTRAACFMHCLPIRRNVEATDGVIDGPQSMILQQAENRLHTEKAVLSALL